MTRARISDFIGRKDELETIRRIIAAPDRGVHVVLISGESGIGKTRLLEEIPGYCCNLQNVAYASTVDCYRTSAHVPFSVESHLARELGPFPSFDLSFREWCRLKLLSVDASPLGAFDAVRESFVRDYNTRARKQRLVLRFDTVEVALRSDLWERIVELARDIENSVLLLAGQRFGAARSELEELYRAHNVHVEAIPLRDLNREEISEFIRRRRDDDTVLDEQTQEKIAILTDGRPVLLTLAAEWLQRSIRIDELDDIQLQTLETLPDGELTGLRQKVEKALVHGILNLTDLVDQAILQMAWVHRRFDAKILGMLIGLSPIECRKLLSRLQDLPFTRILPGGVCVLHDNVRDLVIRHDWPIIDPNGTYRLRLDNRMVEYYDQLIARLKRKAPSLLERVTSNSDDLQTFQKWVAADTERWIFEAERLFYLLRANSEKGAISFAQVFDEISDVNRDLRELLVSEIRDQPPERLERLSANVDYVVRVRLAKALADAAKTEDAYERFHALLGHVQATGVQRVDLLIQLGNATIRLGKMSESEHYFLEALQLALSLDDPLLAVRCQHSVAWLRRLQGRWAEAAEHYRCALEEAPAIQDERQRTKNQAWIENGLGYVEHLQGCGDEAEVHCLKALGLWQGLKAAMQLGSICSTLGEVMTGQDRYAEAAQYYSQALSIFQEHRAWEWQTIVYHQIAYSAWCTRDLERAWPHLLKSRKLATEYGIARELPTIFHRLGLLVLDDYGDYQDATAHFERGVEESRRHENGQMLLENLVALVEIAYRYLRDEALMEQRASLMRDEIRNRMLSYPLIEGRLERILAQAAFDRSDYDRSLHHYLRAIPLIARHGGYARYKLSTELLFLGSRLDELPIVNRVMWCDTMQRTWNEQGILAALPQVTSFLQERLAS